MQEDFQEREVHLVWLGFLAREENLVHLDRKDHKESLDQKGLLVTKDQQDWLVFLVKEEFPDLMVQKE